MCVQTKDKSETKEESHEDMKNRKSLKKNIEGIKFSCYSIDFLFKKLFGWFISISILT